MPSLLSQLVFGSVLITLVWSSSGRRKKNKQRRSNKVPEFTDVPADRRSKDTDVQSEMIAAQEICSEVECTEQAIQDLKMDLLKSTEQLAIEVKSKDKQKRDLEAKIHEAHNVDEDQMAVLRLVDALEEQSDPQSTINRFSQVFTDSVHWMKQRGKGGHQMAKVDGQVFTFGSHVKLHHFKDMFDGMQMVFKGRMGVDPQGYKAELNRQSEQNCRDLSIQLKRIQEGWKEKIQQLRSGVDQIHSQIEQLNQELKDKDQERSRLMLALEKKVRDGEHELLETQQIMVHTAQTVEQVWVSAKNLADSKESEKIRKLKINVQLNSWEREMIHPRCSESRTAVPLIADQNQRSKLFRFLMEGDYPGFQQEFNSYLNQEMALETHRVYYGPRSYFDLSFDVRLAQREIEAIQQLQIQLDSMQDGSVEYWRKRASQAGTFGSLVQVRHLLWADHHWRENPDYHRKYTDSYELFEALMNRDLPANAKLEKDMEFEVEGQEPVTVESENMREAPPYLAAGIQEVLKSVHARRGRLTAQSARKYAQLFWDWAD